MKKMKRTTMRTLIFCLMLLLFAGCVGIPPIQSDTQNNEAQQAETAEHEKDPNYVYDPELTEDKIVAWALGCSAILAARNDLDPYEFGMGSVWGAIGMLQGSWNCYTRDDLLNIVETMTDDGHSASFADHYSFITSMSDKDFGRLLEMSDEFDRNMFLLTKRLGDKWGDKQIKAWDWFRMIHVLGWGYTAGDLELEETYDLMIPIIERLRSTFSSWDEATENYMDGFAWWSGTDFSDPASLYEYNKRMEIYKELKAYPAEFTLFDPTLWPDYIPDAKANAVTEMNFRYRDNGDGTCTITGYKWEAGSINIPEMIDGLKVTAIGDKVFYKAWGFKGPLTIPDSVTSIGKSAFEECFGLSGSLIIPDSVTFIDDRAFMYCYGFTDLTLSKNLKEIGGSFSYCTGFSGKLTIPEGVEKIGSGAFYWCENFSGELILPQSLKEVGQSAFGGCSSLTGVEVQENLIKIDVATSFQYCSGITSIIVSDQNPAYKIVDGILYSKDNSQLLYVPEGMEKNNYSIPSGTSEICENAFYGCTGFTGKLTIPSGVVKLGRKAFNGCIGLDGIIIPDSVTTIESEVFNGCNNIKSITIPGGVMSVNWVLEDCDSLEVVEFLGDAPEKFPKNFFRGSTNENAKIIYNPAKSGWSTPLWNETPCYPRWKR